MSHSTFCPLDGPGAEECPVCIAIHLAQEANTTALRDTFESNRKRIYRAGYCEGYADGKNGDPQKWPY